MESKELEKVGLTKNESLVYVTLLQLGTSKTGAILNKSGINSGKIYEILESLKRKGLISESIINNVRFFTPGPPRQLLNFIEQKKQNLHKEEELIKKKLPQLEKLRTISRKEVKAVTYTGFKGIKTAVDEATASLKSNEEVLGMGITEHKNPKFNEFWKSWSMKKRIKTKNLFSERGKYFKSFKKIKHAEVRVLTLFTPAAVDIFGKDKVLILNYQEPCSCILIHDKNIATSFRQFFEQMWKIAKR